MLRAITLLTFSLLFTSPAWAETVTITNGYASTSVERPYEASYSTLGGFGLGCYEVYNCGDFQSTSPFFAAGTANRQMDTVLEINEMGHLLTWAGQQYKVRGTLYFDGPVVSPLARGSIEISAPFQMSGTLSLLHVSTLAPLGEVTLTGLGRGHTVLNSDGTPWWVSYSFYTSWGGFTDTLYYLPGMVTFTLPNLNENEPPPIHGSPTNGNGAAPVVPEPSTVLLLASGLAGVGFWRHRAPRTSQ
jgi:hypothetical protein